MPKLSFIGVAAVAALLFAAGVVVWVGSTPRGVAAQGTPACPSSWPGATGTDTRSSIGYSDYYTDSDGQNWFIIRSTDSNGYTIIRAYPANGDSSAYTTDSADQVCYLMVRRPGDSEDVAAAAARSQQIIFPSDNDDGDDGAGGVGGGGGGGSNSLRSSQGQTQNTAPTLTAGNVTATKATLTIANHNGNWYYQQSGGSCSTTAMTGNTANITGLTKNTSYTYSAYTPSNGNDCGTEIATTSMFTTTNPTLAASGVIHDSATLNLSGWAAGTGAGKDGVWYYKSTTTTCSSAQSSGTVNLSSLTASTGYTYTAYSDSGCSSNKVIATASAFTTLGPPILSNLSQSDNGAFEVKASSNVYNTSQWATGFTTGSESGGYQKIKIAAKFGGWAGNPGNIEVSIYSNSPGVTNNDRPNGEVCSLSGPDNPGSETAIYANDSCSLAANTTYHLVMESPGNSWGRHWWRATSSDLETSSRGGSIGNTASSQLGTASWGYNRSQSSGLFAVYADGTHPILMATSSGGKINLTLSGFTGDWWFKVQQDHTCTKADGNTHNDIGGYTGTKAIKAYSDDTCNTEIASDPVTVVP